MNKPLILALLFCSLIACNSEEKQNEKALNDAITLYEIAQDYSDANTARVALNKILMLNPENSAYQDSLCRLYVKGGNYEGGIAIAEKLMAKGAANKDLKELTGVAYQQQKQFDKSVEIFRDLFNSTNDYRYLYQQAVIYNEARDEVAFDSTVANIISIVETDSLAAQTLIDFPSPVSGLSQQVPIEAATIFLRGKLLFDKREIRSAINDYIKAIGIFEPFEMPRYYLQEIEMMQRRGQL